MRHLKNIWRYIRLIGTFLGAILLLPFYLLRKNDIYAGDADDLDMMSTKEADLRWKSKYSGKKRYVKTPTMRVIR